MRTLWDPILFTNHFDFEIHVKNLLADVSFEMYVKTPTSANRFLTWILNKNGLYAVWDPIMCAPTELHHVCVLRIGLKMVHWNRNMLPTMN